MSIHTNRLQVNLGDDNGLINSGRSGMSGKSVLSNEGPM